MPLLRAKLRLTEGEDLEGAGAGGGDAEPAAVGRNRETLEEETGQRGLEFRGAQFSFR